MFETEVADGALQFARPGTRWLATGPEGGLRTADAAYNLSVPEGFDRTDVESYVAERRRAAGFEAEGPAMLTGVDLRHARRATRGPVSVVATAGLSNPAALPMPDDATDADDAPGSDGGPADRSTDAGPGTVNLLAGTTRALPDGALATLLATAVEAKTAVLVAATGFTGTTSDAVVVGSDPDGESATFAGSATPVGKATRVCVRDAILTSLNSRYGLDEGDGDSHDSALPSSVADADYGTVTEGRAAVSEIAD